MVLKGFKDYEVNKIINNEFTIEDLNHNNPTIREQAALSLEKNENYESIIPLLNTYFKGSSYLIPKIIGNIGKNYIKRLLKVAFNKRMKIRVRQYAIEGLGKIKDKKILNSLFLLLKDDNIYIRKSVILALTDLEDKNSVSILLNLLERENNWIKHNIIWALGKIGDSICVEKLIELLSNKNLNFMIKKNIVIALGNIGDKRAVEILIDILKDQHSGLEDYASLALEKIGNEKALQPLIKKYLNPVWFLKDHYENLLNKFSPYWRSLLEDYDYKIYRKDKLPVKFFENISNVENWHYGYLNKSHYILNSFNKIVGCLNLIFLSIYKDTYIFYLDTIEIKENYKKKGLGTKLTEFMIKSEVEKYKKYNIFLLVANCEQYKLKFFSSLGFVPVKLRKTKVGTHCIMSYPYNENSDINCERMFEYFNWREEKKEYISSDCKHAHNQNPTGLYWCAKKNIYVMGLEKQSCQHYIKEKEIFNEEKFLDLKIINSKIQ